jgi:hypothetical protein
MASAALSPLRSLQVPCFLIKRPRVARGHRLAVRQASHLQTPPPEPRATLTRPLQRLYLDRDLRVPAFGPQSELQFGALLAARQNVQLVFTEQHKRAQTRPVRVS